MDKQQDAAPDYRERVFGVPFDSNEIFEAENWKLMPSRIMHIMPSRKDAEEFIVWRKEHSLPAMRGKVAALEAEVARLTDLLAKETLRANDLRADLIRRCPLPTMNRYWT
jgi:hypothetical protein